MLLRNSAFFPVEYFLVSFYQANDFSEKKKKIKKKKLGLEGLF